MTLRQNLNSLSFVILVFSVVVAFCAVTSQSLWIDEANSAINAIQPTWAGFFQLIGSERGSELQMPFYMASLWGWEKFVGPTEYALRAMNVPLFVAAIGAALWGLSVSLGIRQWFCLFSICSPMVWTYLDEARPYSMQFLSSTLVMVGLVNLGSIRGSPHLKDAAFVFIGIVLLCGSSLIGVIYSFFFGLAFLACWLRREPLYAALRQPGLWALALLTASVLAGLGFYYLWTLKVGARASGAGKTNIQTMAFCAYELLGFTGAGPGRAGLRDNPIIAIRSFLPFLGLYAVFLSAFFLTAIKSIPPFLPLSRWVGFLPIFFAALTSGVAVIILGLVADFRVIGRHLMPLLPFLLIGMANLSSTIWARGGKPNRGIVAAFLILSLISSVSIRTFNRFAKDDYRAAASIAKDALFKKKTVWWSADLAGANYYGVFPKTGTSESSSVLSSSSLAATFFANSLSADCLSALPKPDIVILSKLDLYDSGGILRAWMKDRGYIVAMRFPAFTVWQISQAVNASSPSNE